MAIDPLSRDEMENTIRHNEIIHNIEKDRLHREIINLNDAAEKEKIKSRENSDRAKANADSVWFYKKLLGQSMEEIAEISADFAETYYVKNQHMSDWMLSQKAFKELVLDFGDTLGLSEEEIMDEYLLRVSEVAAGERETKIEPGFERYTNTSIQRLNVSVDEKRNRSR